ncbi:Membrane protein involved in the export of O-antigen and teichoic acid [Rhodococcus rhodochrous J3]|uniref:Polysaccharide biosynthesis protein n=2 Tax=Rhodococcus rhodochrous TaxID=1829 RepID=A0AA46WZL1_RHORH|nr:polysaccharide biosynthesis protein [Rhodococcus rhodochrous]MBF4481484.1 polysaccharide biosynthesis protein [Rhodococcus rhodochrous]MCB8912805.1 polysaccharide biosynthesis protein [Rhodococcus rhodochrous]TWH52961.1 O-antigen/teichoic acid export membrane protein [Rhodococcus rhodochrous J38]UZF46291.1 polysaccharide biosynthesis protein [Rhodococcus rhodochrous]SMG32108.1 Membrane protein involved in the export of O-antigen and teichoic acid [Rhodococcus rhodochrous J3]
MIATLTRRLRGGAAPGLESNAAALMLSSLATGLLGLVYWAVAERFFPTAVVGHASAVISTATMLASISCLSLGGAYQRFLPGAGRASGRLIVGGCALVGAVALLLGALFVLIGPTRTTLFPTTTEATVFPLMVCAFALYAITDPILIGLRLARTVAAKNIALSVLKIVPVIALAGTGSALALTGSWGVLALGITAVVLMRVLRATLPGRREVEPDLPPVRELWAFQGVFFTMSLVLTLTPLALPLIVMSTLGPEQNAYFNLAWTMCTALGLLRGAVGSSFVVEASSPGADRAHLLRRFVRMLGAVTAVSATGLALGGPLILWLVSPDYFHAAAGLVLVMALDAVVGAVVVVYFLLAQILRRLHLMLAVQCLVVAITIGGAALLVPRLELLGVGVATLTANMVALLVIALPLRRFVAEFTAAPTDARG